MGYQKKFIEKNELAYKTLDRLYECRNLEISNLWQRSAFLIGMLLLIFTGYGYLIFETFKECNLNPKCINLPANILGLAISVLGIIFSVLWIKMGKGSKAWYEVYETAITKLEYSLSNKFKTNKKSFKPEEYVMGEMTLKPKNINRYWFSNKAGKYSPSKINIAIGQYSLIIFIITLTIHTILLQSLICIIRNWTIRIGVIIGVIILIIIIRRYCYIKKQKAELIKDILQQTLTHEEYDDFYQDLIKQKSKLNQLLKCVKGNYSKKDNLENKIKEELLDILINNVKEKPKIDKILRKKNYDNNKVQEMINKKVKNKYENVLNIIANDITNRILEKKLKVDLFLSTKSNFFDSEL